MSSKLSVVITGHSFVARLDNALIMERPAGCIVPQQQLTPVQLRVDDLFNNIYIEGLAGAKVTSLTHAVDLTGSRRPNVVLFIAGSNELCDLGADPRNFCQELVLSTSGCTMGVHPEVHANTSPWKVSGTTDRGILSRYRSGVRTASTTHPFTQIPQVPSQCQEVPVSSGRRTQESLSQLNRAGRPVRCQSPLGSHNGSCCSCTTFSRAHGAGALITKEAPPCSDGSLGTTLGI